MKCPKSSLLIVGLLLVGPFPYLAQSIIPTTQAHQLRKSLSRNPLAFELAVPIVRPRQTGREVAEYALSSVLVVLAENGKGKVFSVGSGFFVDADVVVTNHHVIQGASKLRVRIVGHRQAYSVTRIIVSDSTTDLALLRVPGLTKSGIALGDDSRMATGDEIYVIGNPEGLEGTFSKGVISGIRSIDGRSYFQITAPISPGSSGGPVLNASGEVIGVAVASWRTGQNLNFAIPVFYVRSLLSRRASNEVGAAEKPAVSGSSENVRSDINKRRPASETEIKDLMEYKEKARLNPRSAEASFKLAEAYRRWYHKLEAIQSYKRAIQLKADYPEAYYGLAESYSMNLFSALEGPEESVRDATMALDSYKAAIRIKPDYAEAHIGLGRCYSRLQRDDEAIAALKVALHLNPRSEHAYFLLGLIYRGLEQYPEAVETLKQVVRINPHDCGSHAMIAEWLGNLHQLDEAITYGKLAVQCPSSGSVGTGWSELTQLYRESRQFREGVSYFNRFITQLKAELTALQSKGVRGFEPVERNRKLAYAYYSLGLLRVELGEKGLALEQYKAIRALGKDGGLFDSLANDLFNSIYK